MDMFLVSFFTYFVIGGIISRLMYLSEVKKGKEMTDDSDFVYAVFVPAFWIIFAIAYLIFKISVFAGNFLYEAYTNISTNISNYKS